MSRTLKQLKESIENLISQQGQDAPVCAFVFTQEDVFYYDEDFNEMNLPIEDTEWVLNEIEENDYIYEQISEMIEDEIKRLKINRSQGESQ